MASTRVSWKTARPGTAQALWRLVTGRSPERATASKLYGSIVTQARMPGLYEGSGLPDEPAGRLEMLMLHMALALWRLQQEGEAGFTLARALNEAFVTDMDDCMREMGIGDLTVPRKVKKAAAAIYDRTQALDEVFDAGEDNGAFVRILHDLLQAGTPAGVDWLAGYLRASRDELRRQSGTDVLAGTIYFASVAGH
jgi:cytochrome b pre-mRNA-processing protein 3